MEVFERVKMKMYTIYDHPIDFPEEFVVRAWRIIEGSLDPIPDQNIFIKHKDLECIRKELFDMGLVCIPRSESDSPGIVETWI